ncbi:MAG: type II toxin-antitoxin system HicA family toxin [Fimbriimonadales bacterium]
MIFPFTRERIRSGCEADHILCNNTVKDAAGRRQLKVKEVEQRLRADGWVLARTTGHKVYKHPNKQEIVVVPNHPNDEVAKGTLESI